MSTNSQSFSVRSTHQYVNPQPELQQPSSNLASKKFSKHKAQPGKLSNNSTKPVASTTNSTSATTGFATRLTSHTATEDFY